MADKTPQQRFLTENVVTVLDEMCEPSVIVRKDNRDGGRVQLLKCVPLPFGDVPAFLEALAREPVMMEPYNGPRSFTAIKDIKTGDICISDPENGTIRPAVHTD